MDQGRSRRRYGRPNCIPVSRLSLAWVSKAFTQRRSLYETTLERDQTIRDAGFDLVVMWECDSYRQAPAPDPPKKTYRHSIVYDFRSLSRQDKGPLPTTSLTFETEHTLNPSTHVCNTDPSNSLQTLSTSCADKFRFQKSISMTDIEASRETIGISYSPIAITSWLDRRDVKKQHCCVTC